MEDSERAGFENLSDGVNVRKYCSGRNGCGECTADYALIFYILTDGDDGREYRLRWSVSIQR
jgi:hypothetical protein